MASFILSKIEMEKMLSLKDISLRRLVIIFWSQTDILVSFQKYCLGNEIKDEIKDKMSKLGLPSLIMEQMKCLIEPIGSEIREWKWCHEKYFDFSRGILDNDILKQLFWTDSGTIDYRKTAKNLICFELLHIIERYKLACLYCLDDHIPVLWMKLPAENRRYFYEKGLSEVEYLKLEFCWPYILKGEEIKLDNAVERSTRNRSTFNLHAFRISATEGNKSATEYFFNKLTYDEIENSLLSTAEIVLVNRTFYNGRSNQGFPREKLSETFFYLLSLLVRELQTEILIDSFWKALICLLDWPWQDLFLEIAEFVWPLIAENNYVFLLENISRKISKGYNFQNIFQDFFLLGPTDFKKHFVDQEYRFASCLTTIFTSNLSKIEAAEFIKVVFGQIDYEDRKRLISSWFIFMHFYTALSKGKWHFVQLYLQEAALSKEDKMELMEAFLIFLELMDVEAIQLTGSSWEQFFQFFDESRENTHFVTGDEEIHFKD